MTAAIDLVLKVTRALSAEQQQAIVDRFTARNPHMRGAEAADIIDLLCESDSDLGQTEPFCEAHPELVVPGVGEAMRAIIWFGGDLNEASVRGLLVTAGLGG